MEPVGFLSAGVSDTGGCLANGHFPPPFLLPEPLTLFSRPCSWEVNHIWLKPSVSTLFSWIWDWSMGGHMTQSWPKGNSAGGFWERISSLIRDTWRETYLHFSFLSCFGHCCVKRWWVSYGSYLVTLGDKPKDTFLTCCWWWRGQRALVLHDNLEMPNIP